MNYTAYGYVWRASRPQLQLGFSGQLLFGVFYFLGNGHRVYSTCLMRFISPDSLSPFEVGGLSGYAYCEGDPVNFIDPSGRVKQSMFPGPPRLRLARLDRPNPPSEEMPILVREPSTVPEHIRQRDNVRHREQMAMLDRRIAREDRNTRTYKRLAPFFEGDLEGVLSLTLKERAALEKYVESNRGLMGLSVPDSKDFRRDILDQLVFSPQQRLAYAYQSAAVRSSIDRLPNSAKYTRGQLVSVVSNISAAISRVRKEKRVDLR